ncbi:Protein N-acetyltransferase, RimJ/RimL family [Halomicrobium zhouii]|uniref:Protein N-acetyltransferase, RimJ/RimL family n=1 Tax=Halomicrobium zhouii TaxID=767519 RepID=A0A1I6KB85_9EURY|nr:GNAT family protein [Halomicrobium zhouii]SFR88404.1 Protein N-acetyltransferase, RimJ/RimL family [Halomicrobium zhouii]
MPGPAFLAGDRLTLRTVTPDDCEFIASQWNSPQIRRYTSQHDPQSVADVREMVEESDDSFVDFLPCRDEDPIGYAWAFNVNDVSGHGEIGYWIVESERGQGYATEAVDLLAEWAFHDRQLHRIQARVFAGNEASMRVLEKAGFEREGTMREAYRVEGEFVDAALFGLLAREWE